MKTNKYKTKKRAKRTVKNNKILAFIFAVILAFSVFLINNKINKKNNFVITPEILRSREYDVVEPGDESTDSEFVLFDAFFLKDLNGDGNAESIRGTCNEIGKNDTLYMDLKVINNGHFKDGVITINSTNFKLATTLVKDQIIEENYISNDTKTINLKDIQNGNQKLITGIVNANLNNDTNNYTKINSVTLTGTHVADNGDETPINKTIDFVVDWYGIAKASIHTDYVENELESLIRLLTEDVLKLEFEIQTKETAEELILKSSHIEGTIPELNGYKPISFAIKTNGVTYDYNQETGHFTASREAVLDENGRVTSSATTNDRLNTYKFSVEYPRDAYDNIAGDTVELMIPLSTYYEGYNNTNSQFSNPYVSNTDETIVATCWESASGEIYGFDVEVGKFANSPYPRCVVSKEKPLKLYNNIVDEDSKDYYTVKWTLSRGTNGEDYSAIMKETKNNEPQVSDMMYKSANTAVNMEDFTSNVAVYLTGAQQMFGADGWVKIYDDTTNELLITFNKDNWNLYNENNPYYYENPVKHIRVETSSSSKKRTFSVCSIKELNDNYITDNYTKDEFDTFKYIKSTLNGYYGINTNTTTDIAYYEASLSLSNLYISKNNISTQDVTENQIITIQTTDSAFNSQKWKNGIFLLKFPEEITAIDINSIEIDNNDVSVMGYDLYEENGCYFLKIYTENEVETTYKINIDCNMTPDPRISTVSRHVDLYSINEIAMDYFYKGADIYDVDGDSNTEERIEHRDVLISLISPSELLTHQIAKKYDDQNNITVSPRVARVAKQKRTAEIELNVKNNYAKDVTDILIQGVIPFEGNQYIIGGNDLGSTFSTTISNTGIKVPNAIASQATVYYSTLENPSNDLTNELNQWTKAEDVTNWNEIKSYIIDLGEYRLENGDNLTFSYEVNLPEGIDYNKVSYSEHAVYFTLLTDQGRYSTYTAANKLGLMIAKEFDLELQKFQKGTNKKIKGVTFSINEEGEPNGNIRVTNNNGIINITGLLAEKSYIIKELKSSIDYVLNDEEFKFYTYTDENDNLHLAYREGENSYSSLSEQYDWMRSAELVNNTVKIALEDEERARLKIVKYDSQTNEIQKNVKFSIEGRDVNILAFTNNSGEISTSGLYIDEEYKITEKSNKGFYLLDPIKLQVTKNNNNYSAQIIEGNVRNVEVNVNDSIPEVTLTLEDEIIPTYNLQITKIEENHEEKTIAGTEFLLTSEDTGLQKRITTNNQGSILINDLYQFVEGKNITGNYTLKEIKPSDGYASNTEEIEFCVINNGNELEICVQNQADLQSLVRTEVDGNLAKIILQDKPLFKLIKEDKETGEKLPNAKFVIYEIDNDGNVIDFAKDVNNNYVGTLNSDNKYEVITDSNGELSIPLRNGKYKAVEIETPEGYNKYKNEETFQISSNEEYMAEMTKVVDETREISYIEDLLDLSRDVQNEIDYATTRFELTRNLDFKDPNSYRDPNNTTTYGDYNEDGTTESIITELGKGKGFVPIGYKNNSSLEYSSKSFNGSFNGKNFEISNLYINIDTSYAGLFGCIKNRRNKKH